MKQNQPNKKRKLISVVTPCYNEEQNVETCYQRVKEIFKKDLPDYDREHIFCDNSSTDNTVDELRKIANKDENVKVIVNSRNFGAFNSMFNGLMATTGDAVVVFLPADLQDPPEVIPEFVKNWEEGYEVVYGVRKKREEGFLLTFIRKRFYRTVNRFANIHIPLDAGEFQLIDRVVVDALSQFEDYYPYVRGMIASCGFRSTGVEYTWKKRKKGKSKANWYALIDQGLNGMISFTNVPLRIAMFFGVFIAGLSIIYALVQLIINIVYFRAFAEPGIPTLIIALFFFSGVQLFFMGLLGEYIGAIHFQVRKKPLVIERERINFNKEKQSEEDDHE